MSDSSEDFIHIPEKLEYRGGEFYELEEDVRRSECAQLYSQYADLKQRYTQIEQIAEGGMKTIYRAFDQKTGRHIALAKLKNEMGVDTQGPFIAEARMNAALQHPNIIKIHEIGFDEDQPYFTMDLKQGDSLGQILDKLGAGGSDYQKKYPLNTLLVIFLKICDAVSYSHSQGILHLDIKPDNVQVGDFGEVLLCDWGLARYLGEVEKSNDFLLDQEFLLGQTLDSEIKGTPGYMAPEQIKKNVDRCSQTDIYSLGALLYSILTYKSPVKGSLEEILEKTVCGEIVLPRELIKDRSIPESLNAIVKKAMSVDMINRYETVKDLMTDVIKHVEGYSTQAENAGFIKEVLLFYKRNRKVCTLTVLFFIVLTAVTALFINNLRDAGKKEIRLRKSAELAKTKAEENFLKYREEKEMADLSLATDPTGVIDVIKESYRLDFCFAPKVTVDRTLNTLTRIAESNKTEILVYEFKGDLHFVRQEFDIALEELKKGRGPAKNPSLFEALETVVDYKSKGGPAPLAIVKKVVEGLGFKGHFSQQVVRMMMYDKQFRENSTEHLELVKLALLSVNKIQNIESFNHIPSTKTLTVNGECRIYNSHFHLADVHVSIFSTLDVDHLILRGMKKLHARNLIGLKLKTLDIRGVEIDIANKKEISVKDIAEKIILSEKMVTPKVLRKLQEVCEVIVEK